MKAQLRVLGIAFAFGLLPLAVFGFQTFFAPRPVYVSQDDSEQFALYSARLIATGAPVITTVPAATALQGLSFGLLKVVPLKELGDSMSFLETGRLSLAVATALGWILLAAILVAERGESRHLSRAFFALSVLALVPGGVAAFDYYSTATCARALGLLASGFLWLAFVAKGWRFGAALLLAGVSAAAAAATEFDYLFPLALMLVVGIGLAVHKGATGQSRGAFGVVFVLAVVATYVGSHYRMLPMLAPSLSESWQMRRVAVMALDSESVRLAAMAFFKACPGYAVFALLIFINLPTVLILRQVSWKSFGSDAGVHVGWAAFWLLLSLAGSMAWEVALGTGPASSAHIFENAYLHGRENPFVVILPFCVLLLWRLLASPAADADTRFPRAMYLLLGLALFVVGFVPSLIDRSSFIETRSTRAEAIKRAMVDSTAPHVLVAMWSDCCTHSFGESTFHAWGNYRHADGAFDAELAREWPALRWFRLSEVMRAWAATQTESPAVPEPGGGGDLGRETRPGFAERIRDWLSPANQNAPGARLSHPFGPITPAPADATQARVLIPLDLTAEAFPNTGIDEFVSALEWSLGEGTFSVTSIAGQDWIDYRVVIEGNSTRLWKEAASAEAQRKAALEAARRALPKPPKPAKKPAKAPAVEGEEEGQ